MATYDLGDGVNLKHLVYDRDGALTDATVSVTVTKPDGSTTTPTVSHVSTGTYRAATVVTDQTGLWRAVWSVSGTVTDQATDEWTVRDPGPLLYTDLTTVKSALGKITADDRDDLVLAAIAAASRSIDQKCGRYFYADRSASARIFRARRAVLCEGIEQMIMVDDIADDTGLIVEASSGIGGTWHTITTYELGPDNADAFGRPWTEVRGPNGWIPYYNGKIRLTAIWGWPVVPDEIAQATALLAARLYRRKDSPAGVLGNSEFGVARISRTDPDIEALISPYVNPIIV